MSVFHAFISNYIMYKHLCDSCELQEYLIKECLIKPIRNVACTVCM